MVDTLTRRSAPAWARLIPALGLPWGETVLVLGEDAAEVATAYQAAGAPPLQGADGDAAVLSSVASGVDLEALDLAATGFPADSVELVVLRHVASERIRLTEVLRETYRILRPGGGVAASDVNFETMMNATAFRYHCRIQYDLFPEILQGEEARHVDGADLDIEVVRAGFRAVQAHEVDHEYGEFSGHETYLREVRRRGWRSFDLMAEEQVEWVLTELESHLPRLAPSGAVVEREPWHLTCGVKPDQSG